MSYYGSPNTSPSSSDAQGGGSNDAPMPAGAAATPRIPLLPTEVLARNHALLCSIGYLVLLPLGTLFVRYIRTFTNKWFWGHATWQLLIAGPVIFAGWALGSQLHGDLRIEGTSTPHSQIGVVVMALYVVQLLLGLVIHFFKPSWFGGHRLPQNYLHALLGLTILALAAYEVHLGLTQEWLLASGGLHKIPVSATNAWIALIVVFWALYGLGLALLPRQYQQEAQSRKLRQVDVKA